MPKMGASQRLKHIGGKLLIGGLRGAGPRNKDEIKTEADGRFYGPGVSDNGAGLACLLAVARVWKSCVNLPEFP